MVRKVARRGRLARYLAVRNLPVPETLALPECDVCGDWFLDADDDQALTTALAKSYKKLTGLKAQRALSTLRSCGVSERRLEALLDLSPNYLSRIRAGKDTSAVLSTALQLFAASPSLVDEAEAHWQADEAEVRFVGSMTFSSDSRPPVIPFRAQRFDARAA